MFEDTSFAFEDTSICYHSGAPLTRVDDYCSPIPCC